MRKILALAVTAALTVGLVASMAGSASAGEETQSEVFKISPTKLDKKKPQNIQLINTITTPDDPSLGQPPSASRTVVDWPKQFKFNTTKVPYCKTDAAGLGAAATVEDAKAACGPKSVVSSDAGSSAVVRTTLPAPFDVIDVSVVAFNESGKQLYLYSLPQGQAAATGASILVGKLLPYGSVKNAPRPKGPFKESLDVSIPNLAAGAIAFFEVTIPKSKYVQAKCKPTTMKAQATTFFSTGSVPSSTDDHTVKCKPKKGKKKK